MSAYGRTTAAGKLSVPDYSRKPPREPTVEERTALGAVADALIPPHGEFDSPSRVPGFDAWLDRALAARSEAMDEVTAAALRFVEVPADERREALGAFAEEDPAAFHTLSSVVAGAYLMIPEVREAIDYPGQPSHPPRFDEAAEQIMDGILEPVIERGHVYTPVPVDSAS